MSPTVRNVLIIVALAALVAFLPGAGVGTGVLLGILQLAFYAALAFVGWKLYLEYKVSLFGLGDRNRAILYFAIAGVILALFARAKLWGTGAGTAVWFVMIGGAAYGLFVVWRASREY